MSDEEALGRRVAELEARVAGLEESERMLKLVLDAVPLRLFWKDREFRYLGCNQLFADDAGLSSPEEIVSRHDFELAWKESAHLYRADDLAVMERGAARVNYEEPQARPDGSTWLLRTTKVPLKDGEGAVVGVFGCYEDITEPSERIDALEASETLHRTIFQQAGDGILLADKNGNYLRANAAVCELLGYSEEELCSLNIVDLIPKEELEANPPVRELKPGSALIIERTLMHKDGAEIPVEISGSALSNGLLIGVVRDLREKKRVEAENRSLQEKLKHSQQLETVGRLAGGIAHDFNNLLTIILSHAVLGSRHCTDERARSDFETIQEAGSRAAELTQQLLAFSRKQILQKRIVNLNGIIRDVEKLLNRVMGEDVAVMVDLEEDLGYIEVDPTQMHQILMNLAVNSRDAMPEGGTLSISTRNLKGANGADRIQMIVADSGCGMSAEVLSHLFEPFFTTKGAEKGSGLGLATVYGVVSQSGGSIEVRSVVGEGTTFEIFMPVVDQQPEELAPVSSPRIRSAADATLVLVEDDDMVRATLVRVLEDAGFRVLAARSGEEAMAVIEKNSKDVDLLVSDVVMEGMSGVSLAELVRTTWPNLRVLLLSGYSEQLLKDAELGDRMDFLAKPVAPDVLVERITALVERADP